MKITQILKLNLYMALHPMRPVVIYHTLIKWIDSCQTIEQLDRCMDFYTRQDIYWMLGQSKYTQMNSHIIGNLLKLKGKMIITKKYINQKQPL